MYKQRAFTLIELLMVIGVIGLLVAIGVSGMMMATRRASEANTRSRMARIQTALENHYRDWGYYPEQVSEAEFNTANFPTKQVGGETIGSFHDRNNNPYLSDEILDNDRVMDGFGRPFHYRSPGENNPQSYDLWSFGAGGEDNPEDNITNWRR